MMDKIQHLGKNKHSKSVNLLRKKYQLSKKQLGNPSIQEYQCAIVNQQEYSNRRKIMKDNLKKQWQQEIEAKLKVITNRGLQKIQQKFNYLDRWKQRYQSVATLSITGENRQNDQCLKLPYLHHKKYSKELNNAEQAQKIYQSIYKESKQQKKQNKIKMNNQPTNSKEIQLEQIQSKNSIKQVPLNKKIDYINYRLRDWQTIVMKRLKVKSKHKNSPYFKKQTQKNQEIVITSVEKHQDQKKNVKVNLKPIKKTIKKQKYLHQKINQRVNQKGVCKRRQSLQQPIICVQSWQTDPDYQLQSGINFFTHN